MAHRHLPKLSDGEFRYLQQMMAEVSGIHMADSKRMLVAGRLMSRLRALEQGDFRQYVDFLRQPANQDERRLVIDLLTTNETYFFREPRHFEFLGQWAATQRGPLHLWSAASSSGEEAYSIAMTLAEHARTPHWSVFASDLSLRVLERARQGIYPLEQAAQFPADWLQRHCLRGVNDHEGSFRIGQQLRHRVAFAELNLMRELPAEVGPFNVIFLRNVLIYFSNPDKRAIVERLVERLRPGGLLFIGHAESLHGFTLPLRTLRPSVFERT
ncbi:CheR family methyltransferase [Pseudomonas paralcaligenes]|uniref:CheR family methyltransferase n=1 Tax=Pseudomonas paralcaligenes TaxID=2772558 RepID=UPI001C7FAFF5|nr:CheR family methyltransferase [Pseudomonas paralcaligenes]